MSGTRRVPLVRRSAVQITPRAVELFVAMSKLRCTCLPPSPTREPCSGCRRWFDLHDALHEALQCEPWEWPCVSRQGPRRAGSTCWNEAIAARMAMLQEAARRPAAPSSSEEGSHAEPVAGQDTLT
jgi:hypothetical protein